MATFREESPGDYVMEGKSAWIKIGDVQLYLTHEDNLLSVECLPCVNELDPMAPPLESFTVMTKADGEPSRELAAEYQQGEER